MRKTITVVVAALVGAIVATPIAVYASHSFDDVPPSNTFHEDIAWMKDNGVTFGCNPPLNDQYCPDDFVTRGQMAAFMRRLAEKQVVDAGTLDGADGANYGNPAASTLADNLQIPLSGTVNLGELSIDTPDAGGLVIDAVLTPQTDGGVMLGRFWIQVDDTECSSSNLSSVMWGVVNTPVDGGERGGSASITGTAEVSSGAHTVSLCASSISAGPGLPLFDVSLVAEYVTSVTRTGSL